METFGEQRDIMCSSSNDFKCFYSSGIQKFDGTDPVLVKNVIDCLLVATSHSTNDFKEQTLCLDTSQLALIRAPVARLAY